MTFEAWCVVVVPFPFVDTAAAKPRPALIISNGDFNRKNGHTVLAMITTAARTAWPDDAVLADWQNVGLTAPCVVRPKLFTLGNGLLSRKIGDLSDHDRGRVKAMLSSMLAH